MVRIKIEKIVPSMRNLEVVGRVSEKVRGRGWKPDSDRQTLPPRCFRMNRDDETEPLEMADRCR